MKERADVKRYDCDVNDEGIAVMVESHDGGFVGYEDWCLHRAHARLSEAELWVLLWKVAVWREKALAAKGGDPVWASFPHRDIRDALDTFDPGLL